MGIHWFEDEVYHGHMIDEIAIRSRYEAMRPGLNERERRLLAAAEARTAGYGGVSAVARATGIARTPSPRAHPRPSHEALVSTRRLSSSLSSTGIRQSSSASRSP